MANQYKTFWVGTEDQAGEDALNLFMKTHKVLHVERVYSPQSGVGGWAFCVEYIGGEKVAPKSGSHIPKIDYRVVLDEETFTIYSAIRNWRKERSEKDGVPIYNVATNKQMAEVAEKRIESLSELASVPGYGKARIEKYGRVLK